MRHCIVVKFVESVDYKKMLNEIKALFDNCKRIDGISDVRVLSNCVNRDNRYDIMIELNMSIDALKAYDECEWHRIWKDKYGKLIEKKAIFDYED